MWNSSHGRPHKSAWLLNSLARLRRGVDAIQIETHVPHLWPVPQPGQRNDPAHRPREAKSQAAAGGIVLAPPGRFTAHACRSLGLPRDGEAG